MIWYYVAHEWAKQLAFNAWGDLDFGNMNVIEIPADVHFYAIKAPSKVSCRSQEKDYSQISLLGHELINLEKFTDPINKEITRLGYGEQTNTLALGVTHILHR